VGHISAIETFLESVPKLESNGQVGEKVIQSFDCTYFGLRP